MITCKGCGEKSPDAAKGMDIVAACDDCMRIHKTTKMPNGYTSFLDYVLRINSSAGDDDLGKLCRMELHDLRAKLEAVTEDRDTCCSDADEWESRFATLKNWLNEAESH